MRDGRKIYILVCDEPGSSIVGAKRFVVDMRHEVGARSLWVVDGAEVWRGRPTCESRQDDVTPGRSFKLNSTTDMMVAVCLLFDYLLVIVIRLCSSL
jgi:hypothetical protein